MPSTLGKALVGIDQVVHLAARVGVGQSMYEMADYTSVNTLGNRRAPPGSPRPSGRAPGGAFSMSVYGEGLYHGPGGTPMAPTARTRADFQAGRWDPRGPAGEALTPVATPETKPPSLESVYALGKYDQERMCLLFGQAYDVPTVALRFFNVYGPYQALSNPYTGVLAIFAARLLNGRPPLIFEDGEQRRDFVSVHDVARACCLALADDQASGTHLNVGSGQSVSVNEIAIRLARILGQDSIDPEVTGKYRVGDIRHCFADISRAEAVLGYRPEIGLDQGMAERAEWLQGQVAVDHVETATSELTTRGLTV